MLQVSDQGVVPVDHIQRSVGCELHIDRSKIAVFTRENRGDFFAFEARILFGDSMIQDGSVTDTVGDKKIS